jgi:DNA-binding NtrC family response regulator
LSERRSEILEWARLFAARFREEHGADPTVDFSDEAVAYLVRFNWPTNLRGLRHVVERAVVHAGLSTEMPVIEPRHLPDRLIEFDPTDAGSTELTRAMVARAMDESGGNQSEAARRLGVHRNTMARWLGRLG